MKESCVIWESLNGITVLRQEFCLLIVVNKLKGKREFYTGFARVSTFRQLE